MGDSSRAVASLSLSRLNDSVRAGGDAPPAPLAVSGAIDVYVAVAENGDDAKDLPRAGRNTLATGDASFQVELDEGRAVVSPKR